jgi:DNA polymerase epsilon subunit 1
LQNKRTYNSTLEDRKNRHREMEQVDAKYGFERYTGLRPRTAFLYNTNGSKVFEGEPEREHQCLDLYFVEEDGKTFKGSLIFQPYFLLKVKSKGESHLLEVEAYLKRRFDSLIASIDRVTKKDLEVLNHLSGIEEQFLRLKFVNSQDCRSVKMELKPVVLKNKQMQVRNALFGQLFHHFLALSHCF